MPKIERKTIVLCKEDIPENCEFYKKDGFGLCKFWRDKNGGMCINEDVINIFTRDE